MYGLLSSCNSYNNNNHPRMFQNKTNVSMFSQIFHLSLQSFVVLCFALSFCSCDYNKIDDDCNMNCLGCLVVTAVQCPTPENPKNGKAIFTSFSYNSVVSYECNYGFTLVGESSRRCGADKKWSGQLPSCKGKMKDMVLFSHIRDLNPLFIIIRNQLWTSWTTLQWLAGDDW